MPLLSNRTLPSAMPTIRPAVCRAVGRSISVGSPLVLFTNAWNDSARNFEAGPDAPLPQLMPEL